MTNVTSWTESEIDTLVETWSEVEAQYPLLRCERGTGTLHAKTFALFSKRSSFPRTSLAVQHKTQHIRIFVLFVVKYDNERKRDGGRLWFDLSVDERNRRRKVVPRRARGLTTAISKKTFAKLLTMERVQRWLTGDLAAVSEKQQGEAQKSRSDTSFLSPIPHSVRTEQNTKVLGKRKARSFDILQIHNSCELPETSSLSTEHEAEESEEKRHVPVQKRSDTSTCSLNSDCDDDSSLSTCKSPQSQGDTKEFKGSGTTLKHRDCIILLEDMMELQNKKMRRAVSKLRDDIEGEIQRSSEMLHSIISNQFEDPESSNDVAFVTKVLNMQKQQVCDEFDQFEEKRAQEETANRALLGQRLHLEN